MSDRQRSQRCCRTMTWGWGENCWLSIHLGINKVINREARENQAVGAPPPPTVDALKGKGLRRKTRICSGN